MVTSLPQVLGRKKNRQSGIDEFFKMAAKCSDKDKDLSADKTSNKTSDKDKTGTRTRSGWTDSRRTVLDPSNRKRLRLVQERTWNRFSMYLVWVISWFREPWEGRKDCEEIQAPRNGCGMSFGEEGELVGCEEVARFLQRTYYERLTLYGMWH